MENSTVPILPEHTETHFLAEGAANIVYQITVKSPPSDEPRQTELEHCGAGTPPPSEIELETDSIDEIFFDNKLLRLRKDLPTTLPCAVAQDAWVRLIRPLFAESQLVYQGIVGVRAGNIISRLNKELESLPRLAKRRGVMLADDDYGLLVTAMTPASPGETIVQFKPKWLVQSPSAPSDARRCRTCAKVARKNSLIDRENDMTDVTGKPNLPHEKTFCPLKLVSGNREHIASCAKIILGPRATQAELNRFVAWLSTTTLLRRLRDCQQAMDTQGVMQPDLSNEKLLVAMTLRDCTVFVRFPDGPIRDVRRLEARIGDLDVKSPDKAKYWKDTERPLIEEGWYVNGEAIERTQKSDCLLRGSGPMWHRRGDDIETRYSAAFSRMR
ncbi:uncharacterized protein L3040_000773 [Drepanopeziza brunnea f. sp. 'multigermtubi']|uniref:uncharacterized protein n=1 Tax=Drepanopeziza brunnea f. sp. 'multigermtubi' TaxID=698441 RepID=UPI002392EB89|nr:hypothetical protein L3040_000773 [Drepanopeziza brunnea f. sp. 'multigermtubi']